MTKKEIKEKLDRSLLRFMNSIIDLYADSPVLIPKIVGKCIGITEAAYILDVISIEDKMAIDDQLYNLINYEI